MRSQPRAALRDQAPAAIPAASPIWSGFWRSGAAQTTPKCNACSSGSRANDSADNDDHDGPPRRRSRDWVDDLANRRRFAMHQAAWFVDAASGGKGRRSQKNASADFTAMRLTLAMRFRGILRSKDIQKFGVWLDDAQQSGIYAMQRFARTARRDLDAVTNALTKGWSNGQTEGHINRLKTLKRAMYGRAGAELLRARMLPLNSPIQHGK